MIELEGKEYKEVSTSDLVSMVKRRNETIRELREKNKELEKELEEAKSLLFQAGEQLYDTGLQVKISKLLTKTQGVSNE